MPLRKEPIPWRLPYIGPDKEHALRELFVHITPVMSWLDVIEPGDPVELVHPATLLTLAHCGVLYVKKTFVGVLTPIEVGLWIPYASRVEVANVLSEGYGLDLNLESMITVMAVIRSDGAEEVRTVVRDAIYNYRAHHYIERFLEGLEQREDF